MKKAILLTILSINVISSNNDDSSHNNEPQNLSENETTMKLKEFRGITTSRYYYHQNVFVDFISVIGVESLLNCSGRTYFNENLIQEENMTYT